MNGFKEFVGVEFSVFLAALLGGLVAAMIDKGPFWERALSVVVGLACSVYGTPFIVVYVGNMGLFAEVPPNQLQNGVAFLLGVTGMVILRGVVDWVRVIFKREPPNFPPMLK